MQLLNLAIAFALLALVGLVPFLTGEPELGLFLIIVGELGAFVCVYTNEQKTKRAYRNEKNFG